MADHGVSTIGASAADFEADANWFHARGWRGVVYVTGALALVLLAFNALSAIFSKDIYVNVIGLGLHFGPLRYRVVASPHWIVPMVLLGFLTVVTRFASYEVIKRIAGLEKKKTVFDAFVYAGEFISILTIKFTGGVESPMYLYFVAHTVVLGSVVPKKTLAKHIAFLCAMFFLMAVSEFAGLIPHTDLCVPPLLLYKSPAYVYIITCGVIACMVYIGVSSTNIFRKFIEREKALDMAVKAKNEAELYLDLMSHDLTNYNQTILGNIGLLEKRAAADESQKRSLESCKRQVARSEKLITNVRAFARAGRIDEKNMKPMDLDLFIREAVRTAVSCYPEKTVDVKWSPAGGRMVLVEDLLESVFVNVVENAVKYSLGNEVRIEIEVSRIADGPRKFLEVRVKDDGPGIPDVMKEKIFERYTKIGRGKGIGMGLALAKTILDKYGGSIRAEDRVKGRCEAGSVFVITVPEA